MRAGLLAWPPALDGGLVDPRLNLPPRATAPSAEWCRARGSARIRLGVLESFHSGSEVGVDDGMLVGDVFELVGVVA